MGASSRLDRAIARFAEVYADQNEQDHAELVEAVGVGRIETAPEALTATDRAR